MIFCQVIKKETGLQVEREYKFLPTRRWRFDYAMPDIKLAVEVEGGVWTGGRHTQSKGFLGDMEKYNAAALDGWCVVRVTPSTLYTKQTIDMIKKRIEYLK